MPVLNIVNTIKDALPHIDKVLEDPAWLMFGLTVLIGGLGLAAIVFLYPFGRD